MAGGPRHRAVRPTSMWRVRRGGRWFGGRGVAAGMWAEPRPDWTSVPSGYGKGVLPCHISEVNGSRRVCIVQFSFLIAW